MSGSIYLKISALGLLWWLSCAGTSLPAQEPRREVQLFHAADGAGGRLDADEVNLFTQQNPQLEVLATETGIGVALVPVDATLRSHLQLPEGQGLVVASVAPDSPAAKADIQPRDVLTKAGEQVLSVPADLDKALQSDAHRPVRVCLIRAGKPREVELAPLKRISFVLRDLALGPYWIGVQVSPADETLRAQLQLPDGQGLVATSVLPEGPAVKAGLRPNDVLVTLGGNLLSSPEDLVARVQEAKDQPVALEVIRAGKRMKIEIRPQKREQALQAVKGLNHEARADYLLRFVHPQVLVAPQQDASLSFEQGQEGAVVARLEPANESAKGIEQKLNELIDEVKNLHKQISKIESSLAHERRSEAESKQR